MRTVAVVLFDKTGTLTKGNHAVVDHQGVSGWEPDRVLALAAAAEADSEHPVARAIVAAADATGVDRPPDRQGRDGEEQDDGDEPTREPVGEGDDRRPACRALLDQLHEPSDPRVLAGRLHAKTQTR